MSTSMTSVRGLQRSAHCQWVKRPAAIGGVAPFAGYLRRNDTTLAGIQPEAGEGMT